MENALQFHLIWKAPQTIHSCPFVFCYVNQLNQWFLSKIPIRIFVTWIFSLDLELTYMEFVSISFYMENFLRGYF